MTDQIFNELITAASLAPSADNMQAWEFRKSENMIEVFYAKQRALASDVMDMFGYIGVGAAIQNIKVKALASGLIIDVEFVRDDVNSDHVANLKFTEGNKSSELENYLVWRNTNRCPFKAQALSEKQLTILTQAVLENNCGVHWLEQKDDFRKIAKLDANSSYIRLEHRPLKDELFSILRFAKKDIEHYRYGLTFESLEVPKFAVAFAKLLKYNAVNQIVSKLGFGKMIAKQLSNKLCQTGALCLITAKERSIKNFVQAGMAMEQLWLLATKQGLSIQPYGVLPQYFAKIEIEPETFLPKYVEKIKAHEKVFSQVFSNIFDEYPAILLRIGVAERQSERSYFRLLPKQIIRTQ